MLCHAELDDRGRSTEAHQVGEIQITIGTGGGFTPLPALSRAHHNRYGNCRSVQVRNASTPQLMIPRTHGQHKMTQAFSLESSQPKLLLR